ncbi:hypothetical protein Goari_014685, partial [Gossypium aridum]|nr:hypothetical protein [Gossypium aridum]
MLRQLMHRPLLLPQMPPHSCRRHLLPLSLLPLVSSF